MLFGLDGIPLTLPKTGVGHYTAELARALAGAAPADTFELVYPSSEAPPEGAPDPLPNLSPNLRTRRVEVGAVGRHWWALGLPRFTRRNARYDLFHGTNFDVPLWPGRPTVLTVHDLSTLLHPETHTPRSVRRARRRLPLMTRVATLLITPSEAVRREVCERLNCPAAKVFVVPEAARAVFRPASRAESADVLARHGVSGDFLLAVGTVEPRKNLLTLLRAFESLFAEGRARELRLVVAGGREGWLNRDFYAAVEESPVKARVVFTGYVSDDVLSALYSSCRAFVYPSLYEGFGLPVLEAMACGAPVVCGDTPALAETAGGAALLVAPRDAHRLARALLEIIDDEGAARRLSEAGRRDYFAPYRERQPEAVFGNSIYLYRER